jgi:methylenetetrahydrofolate reductase (NADPH)
VSAVKSCSIALHHSVSDRQNAAYPDRYPNTNETLDEELQHLKDKVDAGAEYIVTQLFYDVDRFLSWQEQVRAKGLLHKLFLLLLLISVRHNGANHPGSATHSILRVVRADPAPDSSECTICARNRLEGKMRTLVELGDPLRTSKLRPSHQHDAQLVEDFGVEYAISTIRRLISEGSVPGIYFCTMNLEKSVQRILEGLGWVQLRSLPPNELTEVRCIRLSFCNQAD